MMYTNLSKAYLQLMTYPNSGLTPSRAHCSRSLFLLDSKKSACLQSSCKKEANVLNGEEMVEI